MNTEQYTEEERETVAMMKEELKKEELEKLEVANMRIDELETEIVKFKNVLIEKDNEISEFREQMGQTNAKKSEMHTLQEQLRATMNLKIAEIAE